MICRAVNRPACKILFDMYHMQRNEGHIIPHIDLAWRRSATSRSATTRAARSRAPARSTTATSSSTFTAKMQADKRDFIFGMEHGNAFRGKEGEQKLIDAYVWSDTF